MTSTTESLGIGAGDRLSIGDVAKTCKVTPSTIYRWIKDGFKGVRLESERQIPGGTTVVSREALETFIQAVTRLSNA